MQNLIVTRKRSFVAGAKRSTRQRPVRRYAQQQGAYLDEHPRLHLAPLKHLVVFEEGAVEGDGEEGGVAGVQRAQRQLRAAAGETGAVGGKPYMVYIPYKSRG